MRLVISTLNLLLNIIEVGAETGTQVHFPSISKRLPPAEVIVPVMVRHIECTLQVITVNICGSQSEIVVGESCIILDHSAILCFDPEICVGIMKGREIKIIRLLTDKSEINSHVHITVTHAPGGFFIFCQLLCTHTHDDG